MIQHGKPRGPDDVDAVVGCQHYLTPYYDKALRDLVLGPHSPELVAVTRFYPTLTPQVVVDFEPQDGKFYVEAKRRYFTPKGVVYIPVFLGERLTKEQFAERAKREYELTQLGKMQAGDDFAMQIVNVDHLFDDPDLQRAIKTETIRRFGLLEKVRMRKFIGATRAKVMQRLTAEVSDEFREKVQHGGVDAIRSHLQPPDKARG